MKSSFILHFEQALIFDAMSDAQAGQLIKRIFQHAMTGTSDDCDDPAVKFSMIPIRTRMDADHNHYVQTCQKRSDAGRMGGRGNVKQMLSGKANASFEKQKKPSDIDIDSDTDFEEQDKDLNTVGQEAESSERKPMNLFAAGPTDEPESQPGSQPESDDPKYSGFTVYHAEGEMRISKSDFAQWQKAYSNLDLAAELQALSDWTRETREWSKKSAFMACSAALCKKNAQRKQPEDTRWHKFRPWVERYHAQRNALLGADDPETQEEIDSGAKVLAEYITPDGFSEDEAGRIIAWILSKPERAAHVSALANLADEVPGWGMLITWASNGSRGVEVGDDPHGWRKAANG